MLEEGYGAIDSGMKVEFDSVHLMQYLGSDRTGTKRHLGGLVLVFGSVLCASRTADSIYQVMAPTVQVGGRMRAVPAVSSEVEKCCERVPGFMLWEPGL